MRNPVFRKRAKSLCNPMDCSLPGSSVHGILQARILKWVAISSSRGFSWPRIWTCVSCLEQWWVGSLTTSATWEAHVQKGVQQTQRIEKAGCNLSTWMPNPRLLPLHTLPPRSSHLCNVIPGNIYKMQEFARVPFLPRSFSHLSQFLECVPSLMNRQYKALAPVICC